MIKRGLEPVITNRLFKGKAIIVIGARQTGKTTLLREITKSFQSETLWLDADDPVVKAQLTDANISALKLLTAGFKIVVIDEAQQVKNIGKTLKLIADHISDVQLMVSGSSALELAEEISEPLTGRKFEYNLYPLSYEELSNHFGRLDELRMLEQRLIYGSYPDVINSASTVKETLGLLAGSYLYKDIFKYQDLRKPDLLEQLLRALALQVGSQVSYHELGRLIGANIETVQRYIELLEKTCVIFRLRSFSRNLRNELKKSRKIYFYDNGIRNALINNYSPLDLRTDKGALWENYLVSERIKYTHNNGIMTNRYFWRTQQQQEVDYIEDIDGILHAYEFKWNRDAGSKLPLAFSNIYPNNVFKVITSGNYDTFLKTENL